MLLSCPNLLLIAGTGRNSGKTTLACAIIRGFASQFPVYAVKISPHKHDKTGDQELLFEGNGFLIYKEKSENSTKDSARMLAAGASQSFYIACDDACVGPAFQQICKFIPKNSPVICESPALRAYAEPGIFIITDNDQVVSRKESVLQLTHTADRVINLFKINISELTSSISFNGAKWGMNDP